MNKTNLSCSSIIGLLDKAVGFIRDHRADYVGNPTRDFTRDRSLPLTDILLFGISQGPVSTKNNLFDYCVGKGLAERTGTDHRIPNESAFTQQCEKLKPEAGCALPERLNENLARIESRPKMHRLCADGILLLFQSSARDSDPAYRRENCGDCAMHVTAVYAKTMQRSEDAEISPFHKMNEPRVFVHACGSA